MAEHTVLLLCSLFLLCTASVNKPRDLVSEVEDQLLELSSLVQGEILAAHNNLDDIKTEFVSNSNEVYEDASLSLKQEFEEIEAHLTVIVDLAISAGYDVSSCTNYREDVLKRLPDQYDSEIDQCITDVNREKDELLEDAKYFIDIIMNKVFRLEYEFLSCKEDILCISPLVTEIELYKVSLLQDIEKEVQSVEGQVTTLELSVKSCSDTNIADFVASSNSILADITACIDRMVE